MPIGPLEILILLVIVLVLFNYKKLPGLGKSAGESARVGGEKAKELAETVSAKVDEKVEGLDTGGIGRSAGKQVREAREFRDSVTGLGESNTASTKAADTKAASTRTASTKTASTKTTDQEPTDTKAADAAAGDATTKGSDSSG